LGLEKTQRLEGEGFVKGGEKSVDKIYGSIYTTYAMGYFFLPLSTCRKIESLTTHFYRGRGC